MPTAAITSVRLAIPRGWPVRSAWPGIHQAASSAHSQGMAETTPTSRPTLVPSRPATWLGR
ncbi:hypothetical protein [Delftia sp.]|uniref:hypothetical protein n=1 Tax=Delftia sp. TaxID=1886637 RepID=UPI00338D9196